MADVQNTGPRGGGVGREDGRVAASLDRYWRANLKIMAVLLAIWAAVGLGCGVLFADWLNAFKIGGFPLGFWFAHQGSIAVFVALILVYCILMNRLDRKHHDELRELGVKMDRPDSKDAGAEI